MDGLASVIANRHAVKREPSERRHYVRYHFMVPLIGTAYILGKGSFACQLQDVGFGGARLTLRRFPGDSALSKQEQVSAIFTAAENMHPCRIGPGQEGVPMADLLGLDMEPWELLIMSRHLKARGDIFEIGGPYIRPANFSVKQVEQLLVKGMVLTDDAFDPHRDLRD